MKDFDIVSSFLGTEFAFAADRSVRMAQNEYANRVLKKFQKDGFNARSYPMPESYC